MTYLTRTALSLTLAALTVLTGSATADSPITKTLYGHDQQVVVVGRLTSPMGFTEMSLTKEPRYHTGIDIAAPRGAPIFAPADGLVITVEERSTYGKVVELLTDGKTVTMFAHLDAFHVSVGQRVAAGELIARVGSSGVSSGPQVHIETHVDGKRVNPTTVWDLSLTTWR